MFTSTSSLTLLLFFVCYYLAITISESLPSHAPTPSPTNIVGYTFEESTLAKQFRDSIDWLRPGNPDANYSFSAVSCSSPSSCISLYSSKNPYIYSLVGFILVPLIISLILYVIYTCCCFPWCCCDRCCKKCCCRPCLSEKPCDNNYTKYIPLLLLVSSLIVILWACIEGLVYNSSMHQHLFGNSESISTEVDSFFGKSVSILEGVTPSSNYIINNTASTLESVFNLIKSTINTTEATNDLYKAINKAAYISKNIVLTTDVSNPFNTSQTISYSFNCSYCESATKDIVSLNSTVQTIVDDIDQVTNSINSTSLIVDAKDKIRNYTSSFSSTIETIVNKSLSIQSTADSYLSTASGYDSQRVTYSAVFFSLPFLWILFAILGTLFRTKWFFKGNWCCAMYLGATIMLLFSFFAIISVGWADFCVRLDDFEKNLGSSQLGQNLNFNLGGNFSINQIYEVINACFYGTSLLNVFNLDQYLNWTSYREQVEQAVSINISQYFYSSTVESFENEVNQINISIFYDVVQDNIDSANQVSGCRCGCTTCAEFNFTNIINNTCLPVDYSNTSDPKTIYWVNTASSSCRTKYLTAYTSVSAYKDLHPQLESYINNLRNATYYFNESYYELVEIGKKLQTRLNNISEILDPLFNKFDSIIYNYTNCAWLGRSYGGFKRVGCILLFSDMYYISRAMMVLSFISILVVIFALMMDYVVHPINKSQEELKGWEKKLNVFEKQLSNKFIPGAYREMSPGLQQDGTSGIEMNTGQGPNNSGNFEAEGPGGPMHDGGNVSSEVDVTRVV